MERLSSTFNRNALGQKKMNYVFEIHKIGKCEPRISYPSQIKCALASEGRGMQEVKGSSPQVFWERPAADRCGEAALL